MAELDGLGIAAVLAADAYLQVGLGGPAELHPHLHQLPHPLHIQGGEGVLLQDAPLQVGRQELALHVVAGEAEGHLGEVVGAEAEEVAVFGQLVGDEGRARGLDHGAELVIHLDALLLHHLLGHLLQPLPLGLELVDVAGEGDHHLGMDVHPLLGHVAGRLEDGPYLHLTYLREGDSCAAAPQAHHGVDLVQLLHDFQYPLLLGQLLRVAALVAKLHHLLHQFLVGREELVHGRVNETDDNRQAVHHSEDALEVLPLEGEKLIEIRLALLGGLSHDHALDKGPPLVAEEHVLGAAEADALGAEVAGPLGVLGVVGVGPDAEPAELVGIGEELGHLGGHPRLDKGQHAGHDLARRAVNGDDVAFLHLHLVDVEAAGLQVYGDGFAAHYARLAHPSRHHRSVAGLPPSGGEDALRGQHAGHVVGIGLGPHQDHLHPLVGQFLGPLGVEDNRTCGCTWRGINPLGHDDEVELAQPSLPLLVRGQAHPLLVRNSGQLAVGEHDEVLLRADKGG